MASSLPTGGGQTIPEYAPEDVKIWLDAQATSVSDLAMIAIYVVALVGFLCFVAGIVAYTKEARDPSGQLAGRGGGMRPSLTLMLVGGLFGAADVVFLLLVSLIR